MKGGTRSVRQPVEKGASSTYPVLAVASVLGVRWPFDFCPDDTDTFPEDDTEEPFPDFEAADLGRPPRLRGFLGPETPPIISSASACALNVSQVI